MTRDRNKNSQSGFSLLELLVVVAILIMVMGGVFQQIANLQRGGRREETRLDMMQQGRETLDQFTRDFHQTGFPSWRMYQSGAISGTVINSDKVAAGLVKITNNPPEIVFEGDVDGDGSIDSVRYRYVTSSTESTRCPCIERSQISKIVGNPLTGQNGTQYHLAVENVATNGLSFTAFDSTGATVAIPSAGLDINSNAATLATIRTVAINLKVQAMYPDLQTQKTASVGLTTIADIRNY